MGFTNYLFKDLLSKAPFVQIKKKKNKSHLAYSHWPVVSKIQLFPGVRMAITVERRTKLFFPQVF